MKNINKCYINGKNKTFALRNISIKIKKGEFVSVVGTSGSGKSTLINILGCLDIQSSGDYFLNGKDVSKMSDNEKAFFRNKELGFIFQKFNLLENLTALDNVMLPLVYRGNEKEKNREVAIKNLTKLGLFHKINNTPKEMSGGQQQRVAIARAISTNPNVILADEPTGNLDLESSQIVMDILRQLNKDGKTIIIITHDENIAKSTDRILTISNGEIVSDKMKV
ncbi:MAG: ABC transporter ATP-binding protein [Oscillospiraceae bacterium]